MLKNSPKVSVIIPIYKVENYIERCAISLFEQTLQDIEYIFVNDCTPDNSMMILNEIIERYPSKKDWIKVIHHSENKGSAAVRNTGLFASSGDYIIHCDSDDWVECNMYEEMYCKAIEDDADIVTCDYYREKRSETRYKKNYFPNDYDKCIRLILSEEVHSGTWSKLIRREIFFENCLSFVDGINLWEDLLMAMKTFYFARKISHINKPFYHYLVYNPNSITYKDNFDSFDQRVCAIREIENFYGQRGSIEKYEKELMYLKFSLKYCFFKASNRKLRKKGVELFREINKDVFECKLKRTQKLKLSLAIKCPTIFTLFKPL